MDKWLGLAKLVVPVVLSLAAPGLGSLLAPLIVQGITSAQQIAGASGPEKKAHALELVSLGLAGINATGKLHIDSAAVLSLAGSVIDTSVGVVNLVHESHAANTPLVGGAVVAADGTGHFGLVAVSS